MQNRDLDVARPALKLGLVTVIISFVLVSLTGDWSARIMTEQQPMKMAAAEALYETSDNAPFSLFTLGTLDGSRAVFQIGLPGMLSFMSTGDVNGTVEGINNLKQSMRKPMALVITHQIFHLHIGALD